MPSENPDEVVRIDLEREGGGTMTDEQKRAGRRDSEAYGDSILL